MGVLVNLPSTRPVGGVHARLNAVYLNCLGSYALFARSSALPYGPNQIFSPSGSGISLSPLRYGRRRSIVALSTAFVIISAGLSLPDIQCIFDNLSRGSPRLMTSDRQILYPHSEVVFFHKNFRDPANYYVKMYSIEFFLERL